ncbi:uncharacterized protein METZ01_LOCUS382926, partial [marine metagenome]
GIIPLSNFHTSRSLLRTCRRGVFGINVDKNFREVLEACARKTRQRRETWINQEIRELYIELFELGHAHSVECWSNGALVGGLYGVALGGAFFGESMFSSKTDASKVALVHLVAILRLGGFCLLDVQFLTEHLRQFGAVEVDRSTYLHQLEDALSKDANFYSVSRVGGNDSIVTDGTGSVELGE